MKQLFLDVWLFLHVVLCLRVSASRAPGGTLVLKALSHRFLFFSGPFGLVLLLRSQAMTPSVDDSLATVFESVDGFHVTLLGFRGFAAYVIDLPPV